MEHRKALTIICAPGEFRTHNSVMREAQDDVSLKAQCHWDDDDDDDDDNYVDAKKKKKTC
jgi:hypothetical protein